MLQAHSPFVFYDVRTTALAESRRFYAGMFGWTVEEVSAGDKSLSFLVGAEGPWAGFTELPEGDDRIPQWIPYVLVEDVDQAAVDAVGHGATVVKARTELPEGSLIVIADPGGATLVLWQHRAA